MERKKHKKSAIHLKKDSLKEIPTLCRLEFLGLLCSSYTSIESSKWNALLLVLNIGKVSKRLLQLHSRKSSSSFTSVLEVDSQILSARSGALLQQFGVVKSVANLNRRYINQLSASPLLHRRVCSSPFLPIIAFLFDPCPIFSFLAALLSHVSFPYSCVTSLDPMPLFPTVDAYPNTHHFDV